MQVRVQKWGNSLAVRIPKPLAEDAKVEEGTVLNLAVSEGKVAVTLVKKKKQSLHTKPPGTLERLQPALSPAVASRLTPSSLFYDLYLVIIWP